MGTAGRSGYRGEGVRPVGEGEVGEGGRPWGAGEGVRPLGGKARSGRGEGGRAGMAED